MKYYNYNRFYKLNEDFEDLDNDESELSDDEIQKELHSAYTTNIIMGALSDKRLSSIFGKYGNIERVYYYTRASSLVSVIAEPMFAWLSAGAKFIQKLRIGKRNLKIIMRDGKTGDDTISDILDDHFKFGTIESIITYCVFKRAGILDDPIFNKLLNDDAYDAMFNSEVNVSFDNFELKNDTLYFNYNLLYADNERIVGDHNSGISYSDLLNTYFCASDYNTFIETPLAHYGREIRYNPAILKKTLDSTINDFEYIYKLEQLESKIEKTVDKQRKRSTKEIIKSITDRARLYLDADDMPIILNFLAILQEAEISVSRLILTVSICGEHIPYLQINISDVINYYLSDTLKSI